MWEHLPEEVPESFFNLWVSIGFPDYSDVPWEHLHEVRESSAGKDFRRMIGRISMTVQNSLHDFADERALSDLVSREFFQELARELISRRATYMKASLNLAANVIPYASLLSSANDFRAALKEEKSWVSLLGDYEGGDGYQASLKPWM